MYLNISGKSLKTDRKTVKKAVAFYADYLIKNHSKINLNLNFEKNLKKNDGDEGWILPEGNSSYTITIDSKFGKRKTLTILAHEMVHLKQYHSRNLTWNERKKQHRFNGQTYKDGVCYWERPWEIEAFGRELGLYAMFMESMNHE